MVRTQFSAGFFWGEIGRLSLEVLGFCDCMCNDVFSSLRIQFIRKICSIQMSKGLMNNWEEALKAPKDRLKSSEILLKDYYRTKIQN